jgi:hypothetical protein
MLHFISSSGHTERLSLVQQLKKEPGHYYTQQQAAEKHMVSISVTVRLLCKSPTSFALGSILTFGKFQPA